MVPLHAEPETHAEEQLHGEEDQADEDDVPVIGPRKLGEAESKHGRT